jgi:hypothetical protein
MRTVALGTSSSGGFLGKSSLPAHPIAREAERQGRRWLVVSYLFCPCHIPLALALLGGLLGGSAVGAAITGDALRFGVGLTLIYAVVLWRGFGLIRRAKRIEASGGALRCTPSGCHVDDRASVGAVAASQ